MIGLAEQFGGEPANPVPFVETVTVTGMLATVDFSYWQEWHLEPEFKQLFPNFPDKWPSK